MSKLRYLFILVLFILSSGFQLWIFTALKTDKRLLLFDNFAEIRLMEFVLASFIFLVAVLALYDFIVMLLKGRED